MTIESIRRILTNMIYEESPTFNRAQREVLYMILDLLEKALKKENTDDVDA